LTRFKEYLATVEAALTSLSDEKRSLITRWISLRGLLFILKDINIINKDEKWRNMKQLLMIRKSIVDITSILGRDLLQKQIVKVLRGTPI
jgi:hypothetical protein